MKTRPICL